MSEVFGIFQIGPVQEFITSARRTQDFWSGSYLLSFLSCVAINSVVESCGRDEQVIIYPSVKGQALFEYVKGLRQAGRDPWEKPPQNEELTPAIPHRFVCQMDEARAAAILKEEAEENLRTTFSQIMTQVKLKLEEKIPHIIKSRDIWNEIWQRQGKGVFEVYWTVYPLESKTYQEAYSQAETLFGARKAVRDFEPISEPGWKCTLCGQREALHSQTDGSLKRGILKEFWKELRTRTGYRFREGEHLCALCTTRRLAPSWVFQCPSDFPSTSSVAVADFVDQIVQKYNSCPTSFLVGGKNLILDFVLQAKKVARQVELDFSVQPLPRLEAQSNRSPQLLELTQLDGGWLIKDTYEKMIQQDPQLETEIGKGIAALKSLVNKLTEVSDGGSAAPGKYYAVFQMDGDNIGEKVARQGSKQAHQGFSEALCRFSRAVSDLIEKQHLGKVVYFGGDEGVAFVSLHHLLPTIENCRLKFQALVPDATASIGAAIAHYEQPLLQVLLEARRALGKAKEYGKQAFCIALIKRSGGTAYALAQWQYGKFKTISFLNELVERYRRGELSDAWYRQLVREQLGLLEESSLKEGRAKANVDLARLEIRRLVYRHANKKMPAEQREALIDQLEQLIGQVDDWEHFIALMELAAYLGRGGGR